MSSVTDESYDPDEHEPLPEGEEAPPPLVHTMAVVRWVIFGAMSLFALVMVLGHFGLNPMAAVSEQAAQYNCPMHPTYISNQPGECPICGMSLVPIKGDAHDSMGASQATHEELATSRAKPGQYTCPMHPEVVSDTAGRCPKCNMFLRQVLSAETVYTCPMHPEVTSDKPGQCPKCGMDLVPQSATEPSAASEMSDMGSAPVPGLVPVTIEPQRLQLIGVKTAKVEMRGLGASRRLVGFVTPDETRLANVQVRISGWVKNLFVDQTGQLVEKGEPLLSIYSQELYEAQRDFLQARDGLALSSGDSVMAAMRRQIEAASRERLRLLGLSATEIDEVAGADLPSSELALRSPVRGFVLEKAVVAGQFVAPDQPLFAIADLSRVWVLADVYEHDATTVHTGQPVRVSVSAYPGTVFDGTVGFIYPEVSAATRTLKARIELDNPSMQLRPGMYAEVVIAGSDEPVLAIPAEAVMDGGETRYAFVVHNGTHFEPRLVSTGRSSDEWVEILSGLSAGETVVTSANFLIDSESRLKAAISGMGGTDQGSHSGHTPQ